MRTWIEPSGAATAAGTWTLSHPDTTGLFPPTTPAAETCVSVIVGNGARAGPAQKTCRAPFFALASPRFDAAPLWARVICVQRPAGPAFADAARNARVAVAARSTAAPFSCLCVSVLMERFPPGRAARERAGRGGGR